MVEDFTEIFSLSLSLAGLHRQSSLHSKRYSERDIQFDEMKLQRKIQAAREREKRNWSQTRAACAKFPSTRFTSKTRIS